MRLKNFLIIALSLCLCVFLLTACFNNTAENNAGSSDPSEYSESSELDEDKETADTDDTSSSQESTAASENITSEGNAVTDNANSSDLVAALARIGRLHPIRFLDHTSGEEVSARVVLGPSFNDCYLCFYSDSSFELYLDTASGSVKNGVFTASGSVISAEYSSGKGAEYDIVYDDSQDIVAVVVTYGDYDIYFG